jgi:integrase
MNRTAARNYFTALEEAGRSANTIRQAKVVLGALFTMAVSDGYLDVNPFHDVKTPRLRGPRAIKIATTDQYLNVRACLPTKPAQVFSTLLVSSGLRFCEAIGLRPMEFDFDLCILEIARSVVKVSREHHPQGKTFLVRELHEERGLARLCVAPASSSARYSGTTPTQDRPHNLQGHQRPHHLRRSLDTRRRALTNRPWDSPTAARSRLSCCARSAEASRSAWTCKPSPTITTP